MVIHESYNKPTNLNESLNEAIKIYTSYSVTTKIHKSYHIVIFINHIIKQSTPINRSMKLQPFIIKIHNKTSDNKNIEWKN